MDVKELLRPLKLAAPQPPAYAELARRVAARRHRRVLALTSMVAVVCITALGIGVLAHRGSGRQRVGAAADDGSSAAGPASNALPLSARVELSTRVLRAGDTVQGQVVVTNE